MAIAAALLSGAGIQVKAHGFDVASEIRPFAREVARRNGLERARVESMLAEARVLSKVLRAIRRPAEAKPWREYRPIFLGESRIDGGVEFWTRHERTLERTTERFGVPASIIVAIIGVETFYGTRRGSIRVLDALATLGFRYPKRSKFFRSELEEFILLTAEEQLDPFVIVGSYAGAMGIPQFIPSSYRRYAVDFDGDGTRDLISNDVDAIGSVARYLADNGWARGALVAVPARVGDRDVSRLVARGVKPRSTVAALRAAGVEPAQPVPSGEKAALVELEGDSGLEFWLGFKNFYVITRYNHSALYAMAVHQLAKAIRLRRGGLSR